MILQNLKTGKVIDISDKQAEMLLTTNIFAIVEIIPEPIKEEVVIKKTRKARK